ncbi:hypothetical protein [Marinirhabdus gelatinilytica]|uniref:Uncharacterized protein n=1 Tax=Marinirhabdus gelatinilytica TaxID=1703343 RepID=A0A370QBW5_9FLAO|nr:hypothetical protein [Marinirhabdus gelatinilytica]RDK85490.1 hypothetical protein C8D94_103317 [Marinirhabdus gelatinilytica]
MTEKKITIIAPYAFGYTTHIFRALKSYNGVTPTIIYLDNPAFQYKNSLHRLQNVFSKILLDKNLKKTFVSKRILKILKYIGPQDIIFMIRPDVLDTATLKTIKTYTIDLRAYYWDSTRRFPRKVEILPFFDVLYSYDKEDVEQYHLQFLTNYIFHEAKEDIPATYQFFNISTNDYRLPILERLAAHIDSKGWSRKILVYNGSPMPVEHVTLITTQKSSEEVAELISNCSIVVEIQRAEQIGLSFRIFEALGQRKKLITTNRDIVNYDFYRPENILVIDEDNIEIPETFVNTPYLEIPEEILAPYRVENWVQPVFSL